MANKIAVDLIKRAEAKEVLGWGTTSLERQAAEYIVKSDQSLYSAQDALHRVTEQMEFLQEMLKPYEIAAAQTSITDMLDLLAGGLKASSI